MWKRTKEKWLYELKNKVYLQCMIIFLMVCYIHFLYHSTVLCAFDEFEWRRTIEGSKVSLNLNKDRKLKKNVKIGRWIAIQNIPEFIMNSCLIVECIKGSKFQKKITKSTFNSKRKKSEEANNCQGIRNVHRIKVTNDAVKHPSSHIRLPVGQCNRWQWFAGAFVS